MSVKTLISGAALVVLVGVPLAAESIAGARLDATVRTAVEHLAPGTTVTRVETHGRPFLASLLHGEVSSAYADVHNPQGTTTLILQRLHRDTGRVNTVLWFARLQQPPGLTPALTPGGAYTPRGTVRLNGKQVEVTYQSTITAGTIPVRPAVVTANGQPDEATSRSAGWAAALGPRRLRLPAVDPLTVRAVSVGEHEFTVELRQTAVDTSGSAAVRP